MKYEACIGLETHVMQKTQTKMFCGCKHEYGAAPNTNVCPVCLGYPGALPVLNAKAIELCCKAGLLLGCEINPHSKWDRKNYFYPDMSKNYQITQADRPLCLGGQIVTEVNGELKTFTLERIHQEENAAKNTHAASGSLIDYNRAGTALMEIVSTPCMHSADDAFAYIQALKLIMEYGGISDCDLEKGHMRSDVNVSVRPVGQEKLGAKVEIKNMNSPSFIVEAINYEIERQIELIENGGKVVQETRGYDSETRRNFFPAHQRRRPRLPLLPRARPASRRNLRRADREMEIRIAGTAGSAARTLRPRTRTARLRRQSSYGRKTHLRLFRRRLSQNETVQAGFKLHDGQSRQPRDGEGC